MKCTRVSNYETPPRWDGLYRGLTGKVGGCRNAPREVGVNAVLPIISVGFFGPFGLFRIASPQNACEARSYVFCPVRGKTRRGDSTMPSDSCFACGRDAYDRYCGRCGTDLSPENERHYWAIEAHESAARRAVKKAVMDHRLYGEIADISLCGMVVQNVEYLSGPEPEYGADDRSMFPAVSAGGFNLHQEKVMKMAFEFLSRRTE